ncbi:MAG TPA: flagellar brake protein, partial [Leclercia adecarboxylata]|nr:flagellar brake protein [Leclercia adecarboxylata]
MSKILDATPERLVMDLGSQEYENRSVLRAGIITVAADTQGAKVEFDLPQLEQGTWQGLPAFITS